MRARLALAVSHRDVEHREVVLRNKPKQMLDASPKGTVPVLVLDEERVIEESEDIMLWTLGMEDPLGWLVPDIETLPAMRTLVRRAEDEFKTHLDRYKYSNRYDGADSELERTLAAKFLIELDERLGHHAYLFGERFVFADAAIAPFVRQFANTDRAWFDAQPWGNLLRWLDEFLATELFASVMVKYPPWVPEAVG